LADGILKLNKLRLFLLPLVVVLSAPAYAQLNIGDRFASAIEAMHEGIDIIWPNDLKLEGVHARIGLGIGFTPDYTGSNNYRLRFLPVIDIRYGERWRLNGSLLTLAAIKKGNFEVGPLLNLEFGRDSSLNPVLRGISEIDTTLEAGFFARYQTKSGLLSLDYRHALGNELGDSIRLTAGHGIYKNGNFVTIFGTRARWMSDRAMQRNFGITEADAATSEAGLPAFAASSGVSEISANLIGAYRINERVRVLSLISYGRLLGDAKNSPLVSNDVGSANQFIIGVGFTNQF
jgi:outer membrane protein